MNANEVISNRAIETTAATASTRKSRSTPTTRQHGAIDQRHVPDGDPRGCRSGHPERAHPRHGTLLESPQGKGPGLGRHHQDRPDAPRRCHAHSPRPGDRRLRRQLELSLERARRGLTAVLELPDGGTAVGTGINTHPRFGQKVAEVLAKETGVGFIEAKNHFEANANRDGLVECSGQLRAIAVSLFSLSNNIRWLGSGPRCGFYELMSARPPARSSIMPGKVNPVMCESMMQVAARVIGNDQTIAFSGATGGQFELNIMMPVMGLTILESIHLLASCTQAFIDFCALEMEANRAGCEKQVEQSLAMETSLNPLVGYDAAAALAKEAFKTGRTVRELCLEKIKTGTLKKKDSDAKVTEVELSAALNPRSMTEPEKG